MAGYFAVRKGRQTGVFSSWDIARLHVEGFSGAQHKKFKTFEEAYVWLNAGAAVPGLLAPAPLRMVLKPKREAPTPPALPAGALRIYTDGAAPDNGNPAARAGVGVFVGHGDPRNVSLRLDPKEFRQTNQVHIMRSFSSDSGF